MVRCISIPPPDRAIRAKPYLALMVMDPQNSGRYIQVRGPVVTITEEGADAHINALSHRYTGKDYTYTAGQVRVRYVMDIEHIDARAYNEIAMMPLDVSDQAAFKISAANYP
jgi:hypothetical protein